MPQVRRDRFGCGYAERLKKRSKIDICRRSLLALLNSHRWAISSGSGLFEISGKNLLCLVAFSREHIYIKEIVFNVGIIFYKFLNAFFIVHVHAHKQFLAISYEASF